MAFHRRSSLTKPCWKTILGQLFGWQAYHPRSFRVIDGDSLELRLPGGITHRIRCIGYDCPELGQAFGTEAKRRTIALINEGIVRIKKHGTDRYGRQLCEVRVSAGSLSSILLGEGLAHSVSRSRSVRFWQTFWPRLLQKGLWKGSFLGLGVTSPRRYRSINPAFRD